MRFDPTENVKTESKVVEQFGKTAALVLAFISVFAFFFKILFF